MFRTGVTARCKLALVLATVCLGIFMLPSLACGAGTASRMRVDLPSGDAADTLKSFAAQYHSEIMFLASAVSGIQTNAVKGSFTPREALDGMLKGTGLVFHEDPSSGALLVKPASRPLSSNESVPRNVPAPAPTQTPPSVSSRSMKRNPFLAFIVGIFAVATAPGSSAQDNPTTNTAKPVADEVITLSPFVVNADNDQGYQAQNTLMGTRLNTSINDLGVTLTTITEKFWQDLAATSTNDLIDFTPGASKETLQANLGTGSALYWGDNTTFRGVHTENIVRNGFKTNLPSDTFNASRFEFSRGPNAILFGTTGDPMGLVNRTVQDATFANQRQVELRVTDLGGFRQTINLNQVLVKDKLAARVVLLNDDDKYFLEPTFQKQKRAYGAITWKPTARLTLKADAEYMDWLRTAPDFGLPLDAVTPYLNAAKAQGKTPTQLAIPYTPYTWPNYGSGLPTYFKDWNYYSGLSNPTSIVNDNNPATPVLQNWHSKPVGAPISVLGSNNVTVPVGFVPQDFNIYGNSQTQRFRGYNAQFYAQYEINRDLQVEFAHNQEHMLYDFINNWSANVLQIDAASTLEDGVTANPNVGRYFVANDINWRLYQHRYLRNDRATASFHLESAKKGWPSWMGNHDFALMQERSTDHEVWDGLQLVNTTPLTAPGWMGTQQIWDNSWGFQNAVRTINYIDLSSKTIYGVNNALDFQAEANKQPGVKAEWIPTVGPLGGGVNTTTRLDSTLFVWQSRFWHDRIIPTLGWRRDAIDEWTNTPLIQNPSKPQGYAYYGRELAQVKDPAISALAPTTWSRGLVVHAYRGAGLVSYVSPTVNQSTSFSLSSFGILPDGSQTPSKTGKTTDYGFKFGLMDNKVNGTFTRFDTSVTNDPAVRGINTGSLAALLGFIGQTQYANLPVSKVIETQDINSKGWELQFTTNITRNWRASVSYSHFATEVSNIAPTTGRLIAQYRSTWMANPNATISTSNGSQTVKQVDDQFYGSYLIQKAQEGSRTMNERRYKFTFVTNYDFTEGRMKGLGVGLNAIWEDKASTGFALQQVAGSWVPDPNHPFFNSDLLRMGANVSYTRKLYHNKIDWTLQLNLFNIGDIKPYAVRSSASSSAPTTMVPTYVNRGTPQGWALSSTFKF